MDNQRLEDKKKVIQAFKSGKVGLELCSFLTSYLKKYCISKDSDSEKNLGEITEIEKKDVSPYDELTAPLLTYPQVGG